MALIAVFRPSNSSTESKTLSKAELRSSDRSSSLQVTTLSMIALRIFGNLRVIDELATSARDAMALALKDDMGDVRRVGNKFGRMILDRVVSVSKVSSAERAFSASSSVRRRLSRYGNT